MPISSLPVYLSLTFFLQPFIVSVLLFLFSNGKKKLLITFVPYKMNNNTTSKRRNVYRDKTVDDFSPPPLPDPSIPQTSSLGNQPIQETYKYLIEGRLQIDSADGELRFRNALQQFPDVAKAMYSVLYESRKIVGAEGVVEPQPMRMNSVQLPVGYKSWLQPKEGGNNNNNNNNNQDAAARN